MNKRWIVGALLASCAANCQADLAGLEFMLGHWQSEDFGKGATEFWVGGVTSISGVFRGELNNGRVITEFMQIQDHESGPVLRWNHFNEDYTRWESEPIEHRLVESKPGYANFEMSTAAAGLPKNLIYRLEGQRLVVWVGDKEGEDQSSAFQLTFEPVQQSTRQ